jgi:uncharacterized OB-fold protein
MPTIAPILASDIITDPVEKQEFTAAVTDTALLYNRCKRCHRKIKAPQEYGRVCARKMKAKAEAIALANSTKLLDGEQI